MKLISVRCHDCGAPLEVGEETRFVTCNHCGTQLAVQHTGSASFTAKLDSISRQTNRIAGDLEVIRLQNELERIDLEWSMRRESLLVRDKHGRLHEPTGSGDAVVAVIAVAFGIGWVLFNLRAGAPAPFALFGVVFAGVGLARFISGNARGGRFRDEQGAHQAARARALARLQEARGRMEGESAGRE